jgi:5-formyltetrahydrofolate cyclo-ligase
MSLRAELRKHCRAARAALGAKQRAAASLAICRRVRNSPHYLRARHLALYWPVGPEPDLRELLGAALRDGKRCYLPVMRPGRRLWFVRYRAGDPLETNGYGIPEPCYRARNVLAPAFLDLVCVPLAGFDRCGTRLGLGGGYYDRSFAFKLRGSPGKPLLLGVAFACQELAQIPREPWDVPLATVITEEETIALPRAGAPAAD